MAVNSRDVMGSRIEGFLNNASSNISQGKMYIVFKRLDAFDTFPGKGNTKSFRKFKHWKLVIVFDSENNIEPERNPSESDSYSTMLDSDSDDGSSNDSNTSTVEVMPDEYGFITFMGLHIDLQLNAFEHGLEVDYVNPQPVNIGKEHPYGFMIDFGEDGRDTGKGIVLLSLYDANTDPELRYFLANITISPETLVSEIQELFNTWTSYCLTSSNCQHFAQHFITHFDSYLSDREDYISKVSEKNRWTFAGCLGYIFSSRVSKS
ncbi:hypothetical protein BGZ96_004095 [Linnemannia gamsii]|uniref:PPPDE domain-containing protein n=1 Tax=Linnemannia gamsii TaxID=64522 RepID=A0ABQ7K614_9FUNG|nr:hypothetical protein BGZ96_004095 [Linnemannia gamsii]